VANGLSSGHLVGGTLTVGSSWNGASPDILSALVTAVIQFRCSNQRVAPHRRPVAVLTEAENLRLAAHGELGTLGGKVGVIDDAD
jgi:hypothetical protein